ncbi:MAG: gliding motility protein GldN [Bacteroidia bacterium]|nr:gliding motility protein GldN [Bacteroidia bacterium]
MKKYIVLLTTLIFSLPTNTFGQSDLEPWSYNRPAVKQRKPVPHRYSSESNTKYHKRIDRIIDTREKQNLPMHWPKNAFYDIIYCAVTDPDCRDGNVTAYTSDSLENGGSYSRFEALARGSDTIDVPVIDSLGGITYTPVPVPFEPADIKKYRIMEDWLFDYKYSDFRPRIIAIAPIFELRTSGIPIGEASLFWIKMDELRPVLARRELFNPYNNAARISFDDWFEMRMFASYIVKESNVWDYDLKYYPKNEDNPMATLLNAEEIKNDLFVFEHDLWEY